MLKLIFSSCSITCLPPEAICPVLLQMGPLLKITSLGLLSTNIFRLGPHLSTFKTRDIVLKIVPRIRRCGRITFKLIILLISSMQSLKSWFSAWFFSFCFNISSLFLDTAMNRVCVCDFLFVATQDSSQFIGSSHWHRSEGSWTLLSQQVFPCPFCVPTLRNPITSLSVCCCCNQVTILSLHCYCFLCPLS